jgi:hypothetical protein
MAKKPNYRADRLERERVKAAKKAKRLEARTSKSEKPLLEETLAVDGTPQDRIAGPLEDNAKGDAS